MNIHASGKAVMLSLLLGTTASLTGCYKTIRIGDESVKYSGIKSGADADWRDANNSHYFTTVPTNNSAIVIRTVSGRIYTLRGKEDLLCLLYIGKKDKASQDKSVKPLRLFYKEDEDRSQLFSNQFGDNRADHFYLPQQDKSYPLNRFELSANNQTAFVDVIAFHESVTQHSYLMSGGEPLLVKPLQLNGKSFEVNQSNQTTIAIGENSVIAQVKVIGAEQFAVFDYQNISYSVNPEGFCAPTQRNIIINNYTIGNHVEKEPSKEAVLPQTAKKDSQPLESASVNAGIIEKSIYPDRPLNNLAPKSEPAPVKKSVEPAPTPSHSDDQSTPKAITTMGQRDYDEFAIKAIPRDQFKDYMGSKWNQLDHWLPKDTQRLNPESGVVKAIILQDNQAFISNGPEALATPLQQGNMLFFSTLDDGIDNKHAAGHNHPNDERGKRLELISGANLNLVGLDRDYGKPYVYDSLSFDSTPGRDADENVGTKRPQPSLKDSKKIETAGDGLLLKKGTALAVMGERNIELITMKQDAFIDLEANVRALSAEQQEIIAKSQQKGQRVRPQPNTRPSR